MSDGVDYILLSDDVLCRSWEAVSGRQQATSQAAGGQTGARWPDSVEKVTAVRTERESSS